MDTAFLFEINWLAVLVAAIAYFMLGALWYSKVLFANTWVALHKIDVNDPETKKGVGGIMFGSFILMFITTLALAVLVYRLQLNQWMSGLKLGLFTGIAFSFASVSIGYLYTKKPFALHVIDGGYHTAGQILAAIILCLWH